MDTNEHAGGMEGFTLVPGNVKTAMRTVGASVRDMRMVPVEHLHALPGFNKRDLTPEYEQHVEWLTGSMMEHGFKDDCPIPVIIQREGDEEVIYYTGGHTRMEAVARARKRGKNIENIPVIVKPRGTNKVDLWVSQVLENTGKPHTLRELGEVYYELGGEGLSMKDIAQKMGRTEQHVRDALDTRAWPEEIKAAVIAGQISPTAALELWRKHGVKAVDMLQSGLEKAKEEGRTRVTQKAFSGPRIPSRFSASAVTAVQALGAYAQTNLDEATRAALFADEADGQDPGQLLPQNGDASDDPMVSVPASLLRGLIQVYGDIEKFNEKAARKAEKTQAKAPAVDTKTAPLGLLDGNEAVY